MSMDEYVTLTPDDADVLAHLLLSTRGTGVLIAIDDIDGALKVKVAGRWSPPIGRLRDPARDIRHDEREEALAIVPPWADERDELPSKGEL